jgi:tRNA1(Val) A37 N6-methylase TrmN6
MKQTPVHDQHNPDLLSLIPETSKKLIEIGCSSGAVAKAFKQKIPSSHFVGLEIDPSSTGLATDIDAPDDKNQLIDFIKKIIKGGNREMLDLCGISSKSFDTK